MGHNVMEHNVMEHNVMGHNVMGRNGLHIWGQIALKQVYECYESYWSINYKKVKWMGIERL